MIEKRKVRSLDELFGSAEPVKDSSPSAGGIVELNISDLYFYENQPFRLYTGERLERMAESIADIGVIQPIIVRYRPIGDKKYEVLAGRNRANGSLLAGKSTIPGEIRDVDDSEAFNIVWTNLWQRSPEDMLPSELAKALKMQLEHAKESGRNKRFLNTIEQGPNPHGDRDSEKGAQIEHRGKSVEKVADNNKMSRANIQRYIRLNELIPELLNRIDEQEISLIPGVHLSYLTKNVQQIIEDLISVNQFKIDIKKAEALRSFEKKGKLTDEKILSILSGEGDKKLKKPAEIKLKPKLVTKFFKFDQKPAEIEKIIEEALELYFQNKRGSENDGETN
ncbi:ParB/RepB/Spo0J family partition protein [Desulfitobacterium chlororespirans]|uniref:Chromosome partitioning protein, ParB family n=1 Tax=Desulfitobacterium chlororespirans DSM 11544 TaxID=1121395 RepID=A0A1M7UY91_9FIRM|nr:ParB N-terminal domain-containing protein [Desulfitobacterium chlororespirans]SHN87963.1 chromosome partitioning protein, ParB family [Desulfitobacterium chlororespirans DSM 11544]